MVCNVPANKVSSNPRLVPDKQPAERNHLAIVFAAQNVAQTI